MVASFAILVASRANRLLSYWLVEAITQLDCPLTRGSHSPLFVASGSRALAESRWPSNPTYIILDTTKNGGHKEDIPILRLVLAKSTGLASFCDMHPNRPIGLDR